MSLTGVEIFLLAVALDLTAGEPPASIHPVVWIGKLIAFLRELGKPTREYGILLAASVIIITVLMGHLLVSMAELMPIVPILISAYLLKSTFAVRCLLDVSKDIGEMIDKNIEDAKKMLPALVGRETTDLTCSQAASAVIESLSENYVDAILSPIFYFVVFETVGLGLEAALAFKAISTMDSMIGYKTEGLKELGFAAAKLDDLANFIPARLSLIIMMLARPTQAIKTFEAAFNYHSATPSPNSGWPMSSCAGALGLRLEKPTFYILFKEGKDPQTSDIPTALAFMKMVISLTLLTSGLALFVLST